MFFKFWWRCVTLVIRQTHFAHFNYFWIIKTSTYAFITSLRFVDKRIYCFKANNACFLTSKLNYRKYFQGRIIKGFSILWYLHISLFEFSLIQFCDVKIELFPFFSGNKYYLTAGNFGYWKYLYPHLLIWSLLWLWNEENSFLLWVVKNQFWYLLAAKPRRISKPNPVALKH